MPPPSQVPASQVLDSPNVRSTRFSLRPQEQLNNQQYRSTQQSPPQQQARSTQPSPTQQATTRKTSPHVATLVNQQPINEDESADEERNVEGETASEQEPEDPKKRGLIGWLCGLILRKKLFAIKRPNVLEFLTFAM